MMRGYNANAKKKRHIHGKGWLLLFVMVFVLSHGQQIQAEEYGTESQSGTEQTADGTLSEEFLEASEEGEIQLDYTQGSYDIVDAAGLLSEEDAIEVAKNLATLAENTGWSVFAITTDDARGMSAREYADDFIDTYAFEQDGVCFLIDMDNRELYISTTGMGIRYLTDDRIESMLDNAIGYCGDEEYKDCFNQLIRDTQRYYDSGIPQGQYNQDEDGNRDYYEPEPALLKEELLAAVIGALVAFGIFFGVVIAKYRFNLDKYRYDYRGNSKLILTRKEANLYDTHVTSRHIDTSSSSGGGGHSSSTHHSSGGGSHGGGGRSF